MTTVAAELPRVVRRRAWLDSAGLSDALPVVLALAPFSLLIGVAASRASDGAAQGWSGSFLLYGGSAQLSAISLLDQGASIVAVVAPIVLINTRFLVYGATLAPALALQPGWFRWGASHFIVDPTYALTMARDDLTDPARFRRYWMTVSLVILTGWSGVMAVGAMAGPVVPDVPSVEFLPTGAFLAMLAPLVRERPAWLATATAAVTAVLVPVPASVRVLIGLVVGAAAGALMDRRTS
jgi:predicted branched-subunit amino acid permease